MSSDRNFLCGLGARILSEANDLKRTQEALATDLGIAPATIAAVIAGEADLATAHTVLTAMVATYPISLADIWLEPDDTDHGVRVMTAAESKATNRVLERKDRSGRLAPYYEYRDTAMSRTAPFKPEWILELRNVSDMDPHNPDVAYNNGHLLHQTTFFIGPVNFYWEVSGERYMATMNTGDSNYITPFVPHSFASRDPAHPGLIIAVTYGGEMRRAYREFASADGSLLAEHAGSLRSESPFGLRLRRQLRAESLTLADLERRLLDAGIGAARARAVCDGAEPTPPEVDAIAAVLSIRPLDLVTAPMTASDEVVVSRRGGGRERGYPDGNRPCYRLAELTRSRQQPMLKGFDVTVLGGAQGDMRHGLHEYLYNYGDAPVALVWSDGRRHLLGPGDSAYVRPLVTHRFERPEGAGEGRLVMLRVPGALNDGALDEFAAFAENGRGRAIAETVRWF